MGHLKTKTYTNTFMYIKKILLIIVLLSLVVGSFFCFTVYSKIFDPNTNFDKETQDVFIKTGSSFEDVVETLKPYIKNTDNFIWLAGKKGYDTRVKPGKYILKKGLNTNDIISVLRSQNTPINLSFNNQERLENLAGRIANQLEVDSITLLNTFRDKDFLKEKGFDINEALSMYIPNSYQVFWNTSAEDFRDKMYKEHKRFWNTKRIKQAEAIGLTKKQVYALASIVHKETVKVKERPTVAGVYMNRLIKGMRLEADPTVIYALKKESGDWDRVIKRVLRKYLEVENPYNTYKNTGIPPGPIAMPDISAIDAVLNYEKHNYLFFVADVTNFGYHKFAKTLSQHNRNSSQYHKWANENKIMR